jgi:hypothetical protein
MCCRRARLFSFSANRYEQCLFLGLKIFGQVERPCALAPYKFFSSGAELRSTNPEMGFHPELCPKHG